MAAAPADTSHGALARTVPHPKSVAELAPQYDGYILDLWGVLHDGVTAFPAAIDCLRRLRARGARVVILSNAPRRAESVIKRNAELGLDPGLADAVVSSGEDAWLHLRDRRDPFHAALGSKAYHLGPERDRDLLFGNGLEPVQELEEADFVLNTGASSPQARVEDFEPLLRRALAQDLPMVCANPDLLVIRGGRAEICAGAIAQQYEKMGGHVRWHGKPDPRIYDRCFEVMQDIPGTRILAVGDSLRTDIAGAEAAGISALFIAGGIHADELGIASGERPSAARVDEACRAAGVSPVGVLPAFAW
jgi:HAD superfamily hydrolase (TIGR01459 family)